MKMKVHYNGNTYDADLLIGKSLKAAAAKTVLVPVRLVARAGRGIGRGASRAFRFVKRNKQQATPATPTTA